MFILPCFLLVGLFQSRGEDHLKGGPRILLHERTLIALVQTAASSSMSIICCMTYSHETFGSKSRQCWCCLGCTSVSPQFTVKIRRLLGSRVPWSHRNSSNTPSQWLIMLENHELIFQSQRPGWELAMKEAGRRW
eukprot:scaffold44499_cov146-Skeletonema_marinoi.AAC.1